MRPINLKRGARVAQLAIALITVVNATAALGVPKAIAQMRADMPPAVEKSGCQQTDARVQRPPRVPRRERFEGNQMPAPMTGGGD